MINVSGHRIGTAEVEAALNEHPLVAESAVVPMEHPVRRRFCASETYHDAIIDSRGGCHALSHRT